MVNIEGLDKILSEHPFFEGLDENYHNLLSGCAANERFEEGSYIGREGETAHKFYLIRHGTISLEFHVPGREPLTFETLEEGDIFGWSWLVAPYKWMFDIRAVTLCRLLSLDGDCLLGKCEADHTLGFEIHRRFIPVMAERLGAARMRLLDMYGHTPSRK